MLEAPGTHPSVRRGYEVEHLHNPLLRVDRLLGGSQDPGRHVRCYDWIGQGFAMTGLGKGVLKDRNEHVDEEVRL